MRRSSSGLRSFAPETPASTYSPGDNPAASFTIVTKLACLHGRALTVIGRADPRVDCHAVYSVGSHRIPDLYVAYQVAVNQEKQRNGYGLRAGYASLNAL